MATPSKLGAWAAGLDLQTAPADLLLSAFPLALAAPLIGQAVSALAAPEVEARLRIAAGCRRIAGRSLIRRETMLAAWLRTDVRPAAPMSVCTERLEA